MSTRLVSVDALLALPNPPPIIDYKWPQDKAIIRATYWSIAQAAAVWGLPYQSVRSWLLCNRDLAVLLRLTLPDGVTVHKLVMLAGQDHTLRVGGRGNPCFCVPDYQAELVARRWSRRSPTPGINPDDPPW